MNSSRPLLLGHRGARMHKPENTLAAFDQAIANGCDGFEFDVRVTSDNHAVVCHDPERDGFLVAKTPYSHAAMGELLELESVVSLYRRSFLDVELKVREAVPHAALSLKNHLKDGFVVSSFLPEALSELYSVNPTIPLGLIADEAESLELWKALPVAFVFPQEDLITRPLLEQMHREHRKVIPWTVNERSRMQELFRMGVDGIISDDTLLLRQVADSLPELKRAAAGV